MKKEIRIAVMALAGFAVAHAGFNPQGLSGVNGMSVQGLSSVNGVSAQGLSGLNGMNVQGLSGANGLSPQGLSGLNGISPNGATLSKGLSRAAYAIRAAGQPAEAINTVVCLEGIILADAAE